MAASSSDRNSPATSRAPWLKPQSYRWDACMGRRGRRDVRGEGRGGGRGGGYSQRVSWNLLMCMHVHRVLVHCTCTILILMPIFITTNYIALEELHAYVHVQYKYCIQANNETRNIETRLDATNSYQMFSGVQVCVSETIYQRHCIHNERNTE